MELLVVTTLVLNVALDDFFVSILSDGVHVVTTRPEMPSAQDKLEFRMLLEKML